MREPRLFWQLFLSWVLVTVAVLFTVAFYGKQTLDAFYRQQTYSVLESAARLFAASAVPQELREPSTLDRMAKKLGQDTSFRFTVIDPQGKVLADTVEDPALMDSHADRPEMLQALEERRAGQSSRLSATLHEEMAYLAIPVLRDGKLVAVVRAALPITAIAQATRSLQERILTAGLVAALLITGLSWWIARRVSRPLEAMTAGAARFARGELSHRLRAEGSREIRALGEALNAMASQLHERIEALVRQGDERDAMLDSMVEGVLALDMQGRILDLNPACSRMFQLDPGAVRGRPIYEVLRKADLLSFVDEALRSPLPTSRDIVIRGDRERYLTVHSTTLLDARPQRIGVLVVLNDVTRLRQLENVRRDFVANASEELRTPITSIQGAVETLRAGALEDRSGAERLLESILNQANRLDALVNDILSLARIENEAERQVVELTAGKVQDVLIAARRVCEAGARRKQMQLVMADCPDLVARINARLLEQAVVNLVDNAIKYCPAGSTVRIAARRQDGGVVIQVSDEGPGIEAKHLPRLFERFYRVDKARSDSVGGTGLGLAIVKHIAVAHGGSVSVQSKLGQGTTFRIHLP